MFDSAKDGIAYLIESRLSADILEPIEAMRAELDGRETDDFGFCPDNLKWVLPFVIFLYRHWFRVEVHGISNLPAGRSLYIANHSGQIPIDAAMIGAALMLEADPPRAPRSMIERWVPSLPYISTLFSRLGQVLGTPENCRRMLEQEAAVIAFPEGSRGISKTFDKAYQLQEFGHGFMRLALETNTPIIPVAVVGAEEQYPALWNLKGVARTLGMPAFPIILNPFVPLLGFLPLPVKYRIYFGRPIMFEGDPKEDERQISQKVGVVRDQISALIGRGLDERPGVFK